MVSIEQIKQLREETGISVGKCKEALEKTQGDVEKAKDILRKSGQEVARKRSGRDVKNGLVDVYLHANHKLGVMTVLRCESDFVARSEEFKELAHEISLQIAAMNPLYLREEDIPAERMEQEKEIYREQSKNSDKPKEILEKIIEGKLKKWQAEVVLLKQSWVKDSGKTMTELLEEAIAKLKEKIEISQFVRFEI